jgi:hypothetical protein
MLTSYNSPLTPLTPYEKAAMLAVTKYGIGDAAAIADFTKHAKAEGIEAAALEDAAKTWGASHPEFARYVPGQKNALDKYRTGLRTSHKRGGKQSMGLGKHVLGMTSQ